MSSVFTVRNSRRPGIVSDGRRPWTHRMRQLLHHPASFISKVRRHLYSGFWDSTFRHEMRLIWQEYSQLPRGMAISRNAIRRVSGRHPKREPVETTIHGNASTTRPMGKLAIPLRHVLLASKLQKKCDRPVRRVQYGVYSRRSCQRHQYLNANSTAISPTGLNHGEVLPQ